MIHDLSTQDGRNRYVDAISSKTITHTNGHAVFSRCKKADQETAIRRFVVPIDEPYLYLDAHKRPFVQKPNSPKMYCTLRTTAIVGNGFHNHYVQK